MKTFALILYVFTPCHDWPEQAFAIDTGLTESDCVTLQIQWQATIDATVSGVLCQAESAGD